MKTYAYTFVEYDRSGGVYLMKRTGEAIRIEAHTPLAAAQRLAIGFGPDAETFPGPTVYPFGADRSERCWCLLEEY